MNKSKNVIKFSVRHALETDAVAITTIYNQGIEDRTATFETELRDESTFYRWFEAEYPIIVVTNEDDTPVSFAAGFPYRERECYHGVCEFSVYTHRDFRGKGCGKLAVQNLIEFVSLNGGWKLLSRIFPENTISRNLCKSLGFREVGIYQRHAKLDGQWRDTVIVELLIDKS